MRFFLDEDLSDQVARLARSAGVDAISSHEIGRNGLPDEVQLRWAAQEERCLVTRNEKDFVPLTNQFFINQLPHRGILIVPRSLPNRDFAAIARALVRYARDNEGPLPDYFVDYLHRVP
jgi:predicted nuclease of predicted toxin-antitoxin system